MNLSSKSYPYALYIFFFTIQIYFLLNLIYSNASKHFMLVVGQGLNILSFIVVVKILSLSRFYFALTSFIFCINQTKNKSIVSLNFSHTFFVFMTEILLLCLFCVWFLPMFKWICGN